MIFRLSVQAARVLHQGQLGDYNKKPDAPFSGASGLVSRQMIAGLISPSFSSGRMRSRQPRRREATSSISPKSRVLPLAGQAE
jgi:hypothetical protein